MSTNANSSDEMRPASGALKGSRFKHPFTVEGEWQYYAEDEDDPTDKDTPRTLVELRMCALSAAIRSKSQWWMKFRDEEVREKWTKEIKEQQKDIHRSLQLTDNMINYIMGELEAYAALRDPKTGIEAGPYERIWQSDELIPPSLKAELVAAVAPLECVPDAEKDWHPGSNGQVLDLVHPSLWPVVYGRTVNRTTLTPLKPRESDVDPMFKSERFQWLPSDFHVKDDGTVCPVSPYINNVHPEDHKAVTDVITRVLERAVPMFEWVLSDLARDTAVPTRLDRKGRKFPDCIWPEHYEPSIDGNLWSRWRADHDRLQREERQKYEAERDKFLDAAFDAWRADNPNLSSIYFADPYFPPHNEVNYIKKWRDEYLNNAAEHLWPDSLPSYNGGLSDVKKTISLKGQTLQVIVKMANIVLAPGAPPYEGGSWHIEGMDTEAIVSTFIYYYDTENITESTLSFRNAVNEPRYHEQGDDFCMQYLYGMRANDICAQVVGEVVTKQDRCIAFPNLYEHRVSSFQLADPTRPGHRKILVFFLVDPHIRVPSATDVGPQQEPWIRRAVEGTALWQRLPPELQEMVWAAIDPITRDQAERYREELMKERTEVVKTVDGQRFGQMFNLCEH